MRLTKTTFINYEVLITDLKFNGNNNWHISQHSSIIISENIHYPKFILTKFIFTERAKSLTL